MVDRSQDLVLFASAPLDDLVILLVDDDADTRDILTFVLQESRAEVVTATSAQEALVWLSQTTPHLLLSDIGMTEMDGYEMLQQIRSTIPHGEQIQAIALTAYAGKTNQQEALAAGFQCHIAKPIEPDDLVEAIITLLDRSA